MTACGRFAPVTTSFSSYLSDRFSRKSSRYGSQVLDFRSRPTTAARH
jgi:hypothetical protein